MLEEFLNLFTKFAGSLKEEDLADPEIAALLAQLFHVLEPQIHDIPDDVVEQLKGIPDKVERFKQAAASFEIEDQNELRRLALGMKKKGLL